MSPRSLFIRDCCYSIADNVYQEVETTDESLKETRRFFSSRMRSTEILLCNNVVDYQLDQMPIRINSATFS